MPTAGIIAEYDPLHRGHCLLMNRVRELLGTDTAIVCVMSGNFTQRGDFAIVNRGARAEAAIRSGANLVLELPLPWAVSSAEGFARGAAEVLDAFGGITHLAFGCECGNAAPLQVIADCLNSTSYQETLRRLLPEGRSYAVSRQTAVRELLGSEYAALLDSPNNNLAIEYCRALNRYQSNIQPIAIRREGAGHNGESIRDGIASGGTIRKLLRSGQREQALSLMAPAMAERYRREESAGRAPVLWERCQRAILYRLRSMDEADFAALDDGHEGLYRRLYRASQTALTLPELLSRAKTKRYAYARLRRMVLCAWLGLTDHFTALPCIRVLAMDAVGRALLASRRRSSSVPIITKPAAVRKLSSEARTLFQLEARAADLYALAYPNLSASEPGSLWREGTIVC